MEPKLFDAQEFSKLVGVPRGTLRRWKHEGKLIPAVVNEGNRKNYYDESQIDLAIKLFQMASKSRRENSSMPNLFSSKEDNTMENSQNPTFDNPQVINATEEETLSDPVDTTTDVPTSDNEFVAEDNQLPIAPITDTGELTEPLEEKSLEELAKEANSYMARGDDCLKQGLTYYFAAGRRLNEAKKRLEHGQWQNWLAENFSASADTASNYMKLARRFGESKSETFRNLGLATAIKMLALPVGDEDAFIEEQAKSGKPVETQTAREVQANVKHWKQQRKTNKTTNETDEEIKGEYINFTADANKDSLVDTLNAQATKSPYPTEPTNDAQTPVVDDSGANTGISDTEPNNLSLQREKALLSIRQLAHDAIQTGDTSTLQALRVSLSELLSIVDAELSKN